MKPLMHTISAIIITLNEEKNIGRCLDSLKNIADEIIVLDSFSTDRTKEICGDYPATFFERKWEGYSTTKNYANSLAKSEYILSIDADEALSPELSEALLSFKEQIEPKTAYQLNRLTNYCGKWIRHGGWYPDKKIRLWKRGFGNWEGNLHEKLSMKDGVTIGQIRGDLYHYTFHSISQHLNQINKFTDIGAQSDFQRGRKTNLIKLILYPKWKFFRDFILKRGFLDGYYGYLVCKFSAYASFMKYSKLQEIRKLNKAGNKI